MAEEPQPPENPPAQTATEQKQEAAALSNLSTQNISEEEDPTSAGGKASKADHAALGAALSHLSVGEGKKEGEAGKQAVEKKERKEVKRVTVDEGDVKFLVSLFGVIWGSTMVFRGVGGGIGGIRGLTIR